MNSDMKFVNIFYSKHLITIYLPIKLEGRGRRCPNCKLKNVRADLGVKVTLACGKVKYFHHPCLDPYVATHISERLSVDIIEKSFVLLAGRRGYPSISPISKYESTSTNIE